MDPVNNSLDDQGYGITYIFSAMRQLTRDEMIAAITKERETKSAQLLETYLHRNKAELTDEQKKAKAQELLEEQLNRGGTVMISLLGEDADSGSTVG